MKTRETSRLESVINQCLESKVIGSVAEAENIMCDALVAKQQEVLASRPIEGQLTLFGELAQTA